VVVLGWSPITPPPTPHQQPTRVGGYNFFFGFLGVLVWGLGQCCFFRCVWCRGHNFWFGVGVVHHWGGGGDKRSHYPPKEPPGPPKTPLKRGTNRKKRKTTFFGFVLWVFCLPQPRPKNTTTQHNPKQTFVASQTIWGVHWGGGGKF